MNVLEAAAHPDPYPFYASLPAMSRQGELVVAAGAAAACAVLGSDLVRVRPAGEPVPRHLVGTSAGALFGRLMRQTDGPSHDRAKARTPHLAETEMAERAEKLARIAAVPSDLFGYAFAVPARVMGELVGLDRDVTPLVAELVATFAGAAPGRAADELCALVAAAQPAADLANTVGFLTQAYEATAALIGLTLCALAQRPRIADLHALVREVARHDAPVQNTRRHVVAAGNLAGFDVVPGDTVLVLLAAANRDPRANPRPDVFDPERAEPRLYTFGSGGHACPGAALAVAITAGAVARVLDERVDLAPLAGGVRYRASANLRIPGGLR